MACVYGLLVLAAGIFVILSMVRWFEQVGEAIDRKAWDQLFALLAMPFSTWLFPSNVASGRPTAVPRHEPVRGFGGTSKTTPQPTPNASIDAPPPGTPPEFIGLPTVPPKRTPKPPADPDKIAKLREKMRQQGMLGSDDESH